MSHSPRDIALDGEGPTTTPVLPVPASGSSSPSGADALADDMARAWHQGKRPRTEDYVAEHPFLDANSDGVLRLLREEICLRREAGQEVSAEELAGRFPRWDQEVRSLLRASALVDLDLPGLAKESGVPPDFHVLAQIGQGGQGRVFLATQPALADRPVVLKVTRCQGQEYLSLARLQHTGIAPLYWVHDDIEQDRRTLCMPFFGSVTFAGLLSALREIPPARRTGEQIADVLEQARTATAINLPSGGPARMLLARATYVQAVCWLGASMADALHYAHERGLIHLDIKPSNVLLAYDGQPMLLDFHLAREPLRAGAPAPRGLGGTPQYMSPEQRAALDAAREGKLIPTTVDGRSDVYSLGLVLHQLLSGTLPQAEQARLVIDNPQVSTGLTDIVGKCLAQNPGERYANAAALASDLRRHLNDLSLRGVANRDWGERWRKWRRRKPHALTVSVLVALVLAGLAGAAALAWSSARQRHDDAAAALAKADDHIRKQDWPRAVENLERGLDLAGKALGSGELRGQIEEKLNAARAALLADLHQRKLGDFHRYVAAVRLGASHESLARPAWQKLLEQCQGLWQAGRKLWQLETTAGTSVDPRLRNDLLDLAVIQAGLSVRLADAPHLKQARLETLELLADAESLCGPSPVLYQERVAQSEALDQRDLARAAEAALHRTPARTPWEHTTLGRKLLEQKQFTEAVRHFQEALKVEPRSFWANFYLGKCAYRLKNYQEARLAFHGCILLSQETPELALCYHNRALAEAALGLSDRARADYNHALELDGTLAAAALNRGILNLQSKHTPAALYDLELALKLGSDPALTHFTLAQVHLSQNNPPAASRHLQQALAANPQLAEAKDLLRTLP